MKNEIQLKFSATPALSKISVQLGVLKVAIFAAAPHSVTDVATLHKTAA